MQWNERQKILHCRNSSKIKCQNLTEKQKILHCRNSSKIKYQNLTEKQKNTTLSGQF